MPNLNPFFDHFGFVEDPFQSTNASDEPRIHEYFIEPPYFASVVGTPLQPKSQIILAPRGGAKTAQRIMLEKDALERGTYLAVTYDHFDSHFTGNRLRTSLDKHLHEISKHILIALLLDMADRQAVDITLDKSERAVLRWEIDNWLPSFSPIQFEQVPKSISTWRKRVGDVWRQCGGKISAVVDAVLRKYEFGPMGLALDDSFPDHNDFGSPRFHLDRQVGVARRLGYSAIYILIDRIDETTWTNQDADASFRLIQPLVTDLQTLDAPGMAFKFFLWDQIKDVLFEAAVRRDRVRIFELRWNVAELERMLSRRLQTDSNGTISSFNQLCSEPHTLDYHRLAAHFGVGSPRDVIRTCGRIVDEHTRIAAEGRPIDYDLILRGLRAFAEERADELYGHYLEQIRRVGKLSFTINHVASDVFRITSQAARQKIGQRVNAGACAKIAEVENPGSRPLHLYAITDPRLAMTCVSRDDVELALGNFLFVCRECGAVVVSDRDEVICSCGARADVGATKSLFQECGIY